MNDLRDQTQTLSPATSTAAVFMQHVYLWMAVALGVTALAAYATLNVPAIFNMFYANRIMPIITMLAIFGLVIGLSSSMHRLSAGTATGLFVVYAALMGVFLAPVVAIYGKASVSQAALVTGGMFAAMSVFGAVTKKDLSGMGSFLMMGLFGLIIASIVNIFMQSSAMNFVISMVGVLVFAGLTAWDTQKIKLMGQNAPLDDSLAIRRGALLGAMTLYLDVINLFLFLLRILGNRD